MDISQILKGGKSPRPPKPPESKEEAKTPPAEPPIGSAPPAPAAPPKKDLGEKSRSGSPYRIHRDIPTMEDMEAARRLYLRLVTTLRGFFQKVASNKRLEDSDLEPLRTLSADIMGSLKASPNSFLIYFCRGTADDYIVGKHANVGILAARLGLQVGRPDEDVQTLMICGWLHDVGLAVIERIDLEPRVLSKKEKGYLMTHCEQAVPLLLGEVRERQPLLEACLYHHERLDGTGYPKGLKGQAIPLFARILAVAEAYEALSHVRPYRDRMLPHESMKQVIDQGGHLFDEQVVKALIQSLSIYPPGSYVELNNKTVARVVGINEGMPTRPLLLPVFDGGGRPIPDSSFLDLSATPLVRIQRAVDETALNLADPKALLQLRAQRWWTAQSQ